MGLSSTVNLPNREGECNRDISLIEGQSGPDNNQYCRSGSGTNELKDRNGTLNAESRSGRYVTKNGNYCQENQEYFEARRLKRSKEGMIGLWGLGVATVISGDFAGWNIGIGIAGFGGMLIAFILICLMYICMISSIAEMSAALPHTGGAYSFARTALGSTTGFITGFAETIEFVIAAAVVGLFVSIYANDILVELTNSQYTMSLSIWLAIIYIVDVAIHCLGSAVSFQFSIAVATISILSLLTFFISAFATDAFSWDNVFNIDADTNINTEDTPTSTFLPYGVSKVFFALPFAMWFFLGIEELPLAAEEIREPSKVIPQASFFAMITLTCTALLTLIIAPGVVGSMIIGESGDPILDAYAKIFPSGKIVAILSCLCLVATLASFHGLIFAASRNIYSLSRAGYYPRFLSLTSNRGVPYISVLLTAIVGYLLVVIPPFLVNNATSSEVQLAKVTLQMAIFGAVLSYILQMLSYICLKWFKEDIHRPFKSQFGIFGAGYALLISVTVLLVLFQDPECRVPMICLGIFYILGLLYFCLIAKKALVLSPEEMFALSHTQPSQVTSTSKSTSEEHNNEGKEETEGNKDEEKENDHYYLVPSTSNNV